MKHEHEWVGTYNGGVACIDSPECDETPDSVIYSLRRELHGYGKCPKLYGGTDCDICPKPKAKRR